MRDFINPKRNGDVRGWFKTCLPVRYDQAEIIKEKLISRGYQVRISGDAGAYYVLYRPDWHLYRPEEQVVKVRKKIAKQLPPPRY